MIKHYKAVLTTVGPVFIGNGNEIKKFEYIYDRNGMVYVIDTLKLFELLQKRQLLDRFEAHIGQNRNLTEFFTNTGIQPQQYSQIAKYSYKSGEDPRNQNIKEFLKNAYGQPYIPGSSLKGAVRTAILHGIIQEYTDRGKYPADRDRIMESVRQAENEHDFRQKKRIIKDIARIGDEFERKKLNTLTLDEKHPTSAVNSIMRGLRISDSDPLGTDRLCLCKKLDVSQKAEKPLNLLRECILPESRIVFDIDIDDAYFPYDTGFIEKSLDVQYNIIEREQRKFGSYPTKRDGHFIVLGGGSGYVSKTFTHRLMTTKENMDIRTVSQILDSQFSKHGHGRDVQNGASPHTRKMTVVNRKYYDIGVCRIELAEK